MLENVSIPSSQIFNEAVTAVMEDDPTVSYESLFKYKSLFERRFNRARKECISSKTKIPNIGIRDLVRATQQHIRVEKKMLKQQRIQQPAQQEQVVQEQVVIQQEQGQQPQQQQLVQEAHQPVHHQQVHIQPQRVQFIVTQNT